jgi:amino acid adenylation domain-containing protein
MTLLASGFLRSAERAPDRPALEVGGATLTYAELRAKAAAIGATVQRRTPSGGSQMTAVFAHRSSTAFTGLLGTLLAGRGYVPLNPTFPPGRTRWMLQHADCRSLVVDSKSEPQLDVVLDGIYHPLLIIVPDRRDVGPLARRWPLHTVIGASDLEPASACADRSASPDDIAQLIFTSSSTGIPNGVTVTHRNVTHFVNAMVARYDIAADDRFSQLFDHTSDLSVFDMFVPWHQGACVCCPPTSALLNPDKFIRDARLTVWFSVPSLGVFVQRLGVLRRGRYPTLRWSLFSGEPLPTDLATAWVNAAPRSVLENLYGPTELTVACSMYRWDPATSPGECRLGVVPIGRPAPGMEALVVDETLREVRPGTAGELLMTGPQRTPGYWRNPEATSRAHVWSPERHAFFYRTGDRVFRPIDDGPLTYLGRLDHQIKVSGYRVELGEVEATLRDEPGVEAAVAVGWPTTATGAAGIVAFLKGNDIDATAIRSSLKTKLQSYAVPHTIRILSEMPHNQNGIVDRQALLSRLEA